MKDNSNANKYTNVNLGEHIPERKFQLFKRGATSPGVYSSRLTDRIGIFPPLAENCNVLQDRLDNYGCYSS